MKVKMVYLADYAKDFEERINYALEGLSGNKIIDIKFTAAGVGDKLYFQAYIMYE